MQITRKASHLRANREMGEIGAWVFIRIMLSAGVFKPNCLFYIIFFQTNLWT